MLLYFKLGNYASINEPITINFEASSISEHQESNVNYTSKANTLKSILLYGHNASGKSNILAGLVYFRWIVLNSATNMNVSDSFDVEPFLLDTASEQEPSFFEVGFMIDNTKFRYGVQINKKEVVKEWLLESTRKKYYPLFLRINQAVEIDAKRFENSEGLDKRTRKNALFLSVCSQWSVDKAEKIVYWFGSILTIHGLDDALYRSQTIEYLKSKDENERVIELLKKADLGINGVDVLNNDDHTAVFFMKSVYSNGKKVKERPFLIDAYESEGTRKLFNLLGIFIGAIKEGRIVIIDEFDARLHTLLTKAVIKLFNSDESNTSAQLLLACHDTALIDKEILRRDQIYFVEKNHLGETRVNALVEFKARKEEAFERNYLKGKYGGIPIIEGFEAVFH